MSAFTKTFKSYGELFSVPGSRGFVLAGFIGRYPISMRALAAFLLVLSAHGSYALAGAISSVIALTNAVSAPMLGRLSDRNPQSVVILLTLIAHASGIGGLILLVNAGAPVWTLFVAAAVFGLSALPLGSLVRARWAAALAGTPRVQTAYAFEAFNDDIIYFTGPVIVTMLAAKSFAAAPLVLVLVMVVGGWVALAVQRSSEPTPAPAVNTGGGSVLAEPGLRALLLVCLILGTWLGANNVAMVAFAEEHGDPSMGGVLIGLTILSGSVAGLVYGGVTWRTSLAHRLFLTGAALGAGSLPLLLGASFLSMAPLALIAGVAVTPMLVTLYSLLGRLVAKTRVTEGFAWIASSITVGSSSGTAGAGYLVDRSGSWGAYLLVAGSGVAAPIVALATRRLLARTPFETTSAEKSAGTASSTGSAETVNANNVGTGASSAGSATSLNDETVRHGGSDETVEVTR